MIHPASSESPEHPGAADGSRRAPRIAIELPARLITDQASADATVANVAPGGVFIRTAAPARVGAGVTVRFRMLKERICEASGRVAWCRRGGDAGFGVAFAATNPAMESFVRSLGKLPDALRSIYLADVLDPRVELR